jgi:2-polyprenyl-3-methyl-5-hydroxy-6-metoxy-1,4-benzoquinol methylase
LFSARDYISGDEFQIVRCGGCGLAFTVPVPDDWQRYYPSTYYGELEGGRFPAMVEWLQNKLYAGRVRRVQKLNGGKPGKVLDVGCGRGFLLRAFQEAGWNVAGTEMSQSAAAYAREKLGLPVQIGELTELNLPENSFDAVVMWHVLEHFARPEVILREVHRLLRPAGIFLVAVPNFGSLEARLARDKWFHLDVPRHLTHFTARSLSRCLEQTGFRKEKTSVRSLEYDWFSATQSLLNRAGLEHNFLYDFLRQRGAKMTNGGNITQLLAHSVLVAPASVISGLAVLGGGSTQIIYARKI